ncbi:thiamine phosphate synthase [Thalassobaculum sp. OXR-137]|uniref:thiamine phosphate synthase n=1 Tax=Thalassobaculum sp. OXR-137 TaxID=3100173 RepID=UPI002AC9CA3B|nr:thiamine phosphate synthase [Thalassobaculum sp. OXR-137]WPZ36908.1 thiamine phosphate synthase [Thalassobaculum sp. OXR-137]
MASELYLITPPRLPDVAAFCDDLAAALDAGPVACLQLRLKDVDDDAILRAADAILPVCHQRGVPLLMNDRPDLAVTSGCDGVHVGQSDTPYAQARKLMGPGAQIGVTCKNSRHLAMEAGEAGADYVAFGAFFRSSTKDETTMASLEILEWWAEMMTVPCVAIGGITQQNCGPLVEAGADFLAVINAVWGYPDGPAAGVKAFEDVLKG